MKYLLILFLLIGCSKDNTKESFVEQAKQCCSCNGGVEAFYASKYKFVLLCRNGLKITGGSMEGALYCGCDK